MRRFVDPEAEFVFVRADQVAFVQAEQNAVGFDAPGARYPHTDSEGLCSFAALVRERFADDPILVEMARIVQAADFKEQLDSHPAARGLQLISAGFPIVASDDQETADRAVFLYDALYASIRQKLAP